MSDKFIVWGSGGHAKVINELICMLGNRVIALFDNDYNAVSVLPNIPLFIGEQGFENWMKENSYTLHGVVAIGGSRGVDRLNIQQMLKQNGVTIPTLAHPDASVSITAKFGEGTQILSHANVAAATKVGDACIINHQSSIDHECVIGNGVHIAPGATLCGCITIANNVMIGAGTVILPRLIIGENTIVGAGSVVTQDLPANVVAFGNPARIIRHI